MSTELEAADLLTEIRDLLRSIDGRLQAAESAAHAMKPAIAAGLANALRNPRLRKLIGSN